MMDERKLFICFGYIILYEISSETEYSVGIWCRDYIYKIRWASRSVMGVVICGSVLDVNSEAGR